MGNDFANKLLKNKFYSVLNTNKFKISNEMIIKFFVSISLFLSET